MRIRPFALVALASLTPTVAAQCSLTHTPLGGFAGTGYMFTDSVWFDPDGVGPQAPRLVCTAINTNHGSPSGPTALAIAAFDEGTATWSTFGSGIVQGYAQHLAAMPNGELIVGGQFTVIDGLAVNNLARWTGSAFAPLGNGIASRIDAMQVAPNGDLVVLAATSVQRWNGTQWSAVGSLPSAHQHLAIAANGDLVVGNGAGFLRWDGSNWVAYAPGMSSVKNLAFMPNGDLFAAGHLAGGPQFLHSVFAVWDGAAWTPLGQPWGAPFTGGFISDILFLPNGDPVVSGGFLFLSSGGLIVPPVYGTIRWNGTSWQSLLSGADVRTATFTPNGLFAANPSVLNRVETTCPATVVAAGNGCSSSGGANVLAVEEPAWLGGTFRSRGHGLPANALAAAAYGFAPLVLPLSLVFAEAQPGCNLLITPDIVQFSLVAGGQATSVMPLPSNPAVLGGVFHHQLNLYEFDAGGTLVSVTASNALTATVGSF